MAKNNGSNFDGVFDINNDHTNDETTSEENTGSSEIDQENNSMSNHDNNNETLPSSNNNYGFSFRSFGNHRVISDDTTGQEIGIVLSNGFLIFNPDNEDFNHLNESHPIMLPNGEIISLTDNHNSGFSFRVFGENNIVISNVNGEDVGIVLADGRIIFNPDNDDFFFLNDFDPVLLPNGQIQLNHLLSDAEEDTEEETEE